MAQRNDRVCTIQDCDKPLRSAELCGMHYMRLKTRGTTDPPPSRRHFCPEDNCGRPVHCWGLCDMHYGRAWRRANPKPGSRGQRRTKTPEQRFWEKVQKTEVCWLWTGHLNHKGYGRFAFDGRFQAAHRIAYRLACGSFPEHLEVDHLCRVRACVNPAHLEAVTGAENRRRQVAAHPEWARRGTSKRGKQYDLSG